MHRLLLKLFVLLIAIIVVSSLFFTSYINKNNENKLKIEMTDESSKRMKKKIIIFTSSGGRGHVSATQALIEYCGDAYDVQPVYALREILHPLDFVYALTFGRYHSEELYNYFLTHNYTWVIPGMVWLGKCFFWLRFNAISQLIQDYLAHHKPDLVISVIPMINGATLQATQNLNIPFWVIPTDLDAANFVYQIDEPTYEQFFFNVAYDDKDLKKTFANALIPENQLTYAGFPVRTSFLASYFKNDLKQKYNVPLDKPVIMLLMGGLGSHETVSFTKELQKIKHPIHLLLCIGKNEQIRADLENLVTHTNITQTIIGFTEHIAELMAMSDLLITKSGGLSVNEALYMNVPMILDATSFGLAWEQFNRTFVEDYNLGYILECKENLAPVIEDLLNNSDKLHVWQHNVKALKKENPAIRIMEYIKKIIE